MRAAASIRDAPAPIATIHSNNDLFKSGPFSRDKVRPPMKVRALQSAKCNLPGHFYEDTKRGGAFLKGLKDRHPAIEAQAILREGLLHPLKAVHRGSA